MSSSHNQVILLCYLSGFRRVPGFLLCSSDTKLTSLLLLTSDNHCNSSACFSLWSNLCYGELHKEAAPTPVICPKRGNKQSKSIPTEAFHPLRQKDTDAVWQGTQQECQALCLQSCQHPLALGTAQTVGLGSEKTR